LRLWLGQRKKKLVLELQRMNLAQVLQRRKLVLGLLRTKLVPGLLKRKLGLLSWMHHRREVQHKRLRHL
jgi:hypothetical protein